MPVQRRPAGLCQSSLANSSSTPMASLAHCSFAQPNQAQSGVFLPSSTRLTFYQSSRNTTELEHQLSNKNKTQESSFVRTLGARTPSKPVVNLFFYVRFSSKNEDEPQGPLHRCGAVSMRGPMIVCGPKVPSLSFTNINHNSPVLGSFFKNINIFFGFYCAHFMPLYPIYSYY